MALTHGGKLEGQYVSSDFSPYEKGMVGAAAQVLAASKVELDKGLYPEVLAHLSYLHVQTGTDESKSIAQDISGQVEHGPKRFGQLVVCLPYPHSGTLSTS
jgi:hypothetical protein